MISIIICSRDKKLLEELLLNIEETIGIPYEVLARDNSLNTEGICEAYNLGASKAKYQYLVFCHEDLLFHTHNWGIILINHFNNSNARLIGFLGCVVKTKAPGSVYIYNSGLNRQNQLQRYPNGKKIHCYENPMSEIISEVSILDGFFMATKKKYWQETKFSQDYIKDFHAYDIDFSLKNLQLGKVIVVYDILVEHFSFGNFTSAWVIAQLDLTRRWKNHLPLNVSSTTDDLKIGEMSNMMEFLKILISNDMDKSLIFINYLKLLFLNPFNGLNKFFIRKIIFGNNLDNKIKKLLINKT